MRSKSCCPDLGREEQGRQGHHWSPGPNVQVSDDSSFCIQAFSSLSPVCLFFGHFSYRISLLLLLLSPVYTFFYLIVVLLFVDLVVEVDCVVVQNGHAVLNGNSHC